MSWAAYVQNLEAGKGRCRYAGIYGKSPIGVWAESDKTNFPITTDDISSATRAIASQDMNIMSTGLKIGGGKLNFTCLRMEPDILICQGKGENKDHSLVIALSIKAVIIGFNPDADVKTAFLRDAIESIRDYLKNLGY